MCERTPGTLELFTEPTARWFAETLGAPTAVQEEAWPAIAAGRHTLVSAPTGTGKTLSAFLVFVDRLKEKSRAGALPKELQLIYVSPLKSLAGDIRENLRRPLAGISRVEGLLGIAAAEAPFDIQVALRTGDTSPLDRRKMIKSPPHILITTPESLYLLLSSVSGQGLLGTARAIIVDELHALIGSKRGAHLMLSIARLDKLCPQPLQRIGLSATIEPLEGAAAYLSPDPVSIAAPKMEKRMEIAVVSPLTDAQYLASGTIWPDLARLVYQHCEGARSVLAFVEGRMHAEKLAYYVNQLGGDGFARTHHGSVSKEQRLQVEQALRSGTLRLLCATSSMELGIDVGEIDRVLQVGCPRSISSTMQRLGRAGHNPGRLSVMHMFPRTAAEGLYCGLTAQVAREGGVEHSHPPRQCFDVLAQHLVSMATGAGYDVDGVLEILSRAWPFREVGAADVNDILAMLAGDYEHRRELPVRPRILYDRIHGRVEGDAYSRMLAISTGGTIPDRGLFTARTEGGAKLGELDEEFVFEARVGDKFLLGSFAWKIVQIEKDHVTVTPASVEGAQPPFWRADRGARRGLKTARAFGAIMRSLAEAQQRGTLYQALKELGLDTGAVESAAGYLERQLEATGVLPDDRTIIVEHFRDDVGDYQMIVHSIFGRRINAPLALLAQEAAERQSGIDVSSFDDDDGLLLLPYGNRALPQNLLHSIDPEKAHSILTAMLPATPLFNMAFRYNAARALMMGVRKAGRQPLWVQRIRAAEMLNLVLRTENHPLIRETKRECLEDYWDLAGAEQVLRGIRAGNIQVREVFNDVPSPMALPLRRQAEANLLYDYSPTPRGVHHASNEALADAREQLLAPSPEQLQRVSERLRKPTDEKQLHSLLMIEGDILAGEVDVPVEWLLLLVRQERAFYIEPGLWIASEHREDYDAALIQGCEEEQQRLVRRALRYRGPQTSELIAERYFWDEDKALNILTTLCTRGDAVVSEGTYYHAELYSKARHETIRSRRKQIRTLPGARFAALLAQRLRLRAPAAEQLTSALQVLCGQPYAPALWEGMLLPARVNGYRPALLDSVLAQGEFFWHINENAMLEFRRYVDIDWEVDLMRLAEALESSEKIVYEALLKRGASFTQGLFSLLDGVSPHDTLLALAQKGLVHADNFVPVRQWLERDKARKATTKQRARSRATTMTAGRWELSRPLVDQSIETRLERAFDSVRLLCRETVQGITGLTWSAALEVLRIWEYTGRVRRGYFVEGLSGAQFILEQSFDGTVLALEQPVEEIAWLDAADPLQAWGKMLPHLPERSFLNVSGTAVALRAGVPVAVFERQGQTLRVFEAEHLEEALQSFVREYTGRHIFPGQNRLTLRQYPEEAGEALRRAGFSREMQDYVLYHGI